MKNFLYHRECNNALNRTRGQILLKVCRMIQDNLFFILKLQVDKCFSLCLLKAQFFNGRVEKCNYLQWNIFGKWKHIHIRIGKQAEYFHCIIRFFIMCNDKADIIRKVCFIAIALLYRLHSCKIFQILFRLDGCNRFFPKAFRQNRIHIFPCFRLLCCNYSFQAADVAALIIKICADCSLLRSAKNTFCLHMIDRLIFHNI